MKQIKGQISIFDYIKPVPVDIRGICDDGYCPICKTWVDDEVPQCPYCNTFLDWSRWRELNSDTRNRL